jgi:hypothetical protein
MSCPELALLILALEFRYKVIHCLHGSLFADGLGSFLTLTPGSSPGQASSSPVKGEGHLHGSAGRDLLRGFGGVPQIP